MIYNYLNPKRIIKVIPVRVKKGRNRGRQAGSIIYEKGNPPYYLVEKKNRQGQMWQKPEFMGNIAISADIISKDLIPRDVKKVVVMFIGFEKTSFYVVMTVMDFLRGNIIEYDDKQYVTTWKNKPRIYGNQVTLV